MVNQKLPKLWYGGDYNPEQWDEQTIEEDIRMFKLAHIDVATVNVFAWALLQPSEDEYNFSKLDQIIKRLTDEGIYICLATSTAAHPAWMAHRYPDITRVDYDGRKRKFGGRHNSCPSSPTYRKYAAKLAGKLAERYGNHPSLVMWHISNEYGGYCYCDNCAAAFRVWLKARYGTIEQLNKRWYTAFWGHTFYDFEEIVPPNSLSEEWGGNRSSFQTISLDYRRFQSDALLDCYKLEVEAIKQFSSPVPITTNLMGTYHELDYFKWAKELDIVSWDSYPALDTPTSYTAMSHALMRGLKAGQPFMLMEQTPSQQNWQPYNSLKRPGVMRLWSYQAVAHGADTVMFFQLRRSNGACEKYHGAVIEHVGHEHTRVFRECAELGKELTHLGSSFIGARQPSEVGIVYDWENRWALDLSSGPSVALSYTNEVHRYYAALFKQNVLTDMVGVEQDFSSYKVIIAPFIYMLKGDFAEKVEAFVAAGGTFITTCFSGIVDENDLVTIGGYPGKLRNLLGIWAEEIDALLPSQQNSIHLTQAMTGLAASYSCSILCDLIHSEGAEVLATYGSDFYQGMPALTKNNFGKGQAYYIATCPEDAFLEQFLKKVADEAGIHPVLPAIAGIEVTIRRIEEQDFLFVLNHNNDEVTVDLGEYAGKELLSQADVSHQLRLPAKEVAIIQIHS